MTISAFLICAVVLSVIAWSLTCATVLMLMFGDDRAFWVGPFLATVMVTSFWLHWFGMIEFVK
jgi:uncharacterized membrane protein YjjP (DUF1212 family)